MTLEKFAKLEQGIASLLGGYDELRVENKGLKSAIGKKELEIRELREKIKDLDRKKDTVRQRVDTLLHRLDSMLRGA